MPTKNCTHENRIVSMDRQRQTRWNQEADAIKNMPSYQDIRSHCGNKIILQMSYLINGISYIGKINWINWIRAQYTPLNFFELCPYEDFGAWSRYLSGISNCIPQYSVGCNYLSLPEIPASGIKVLIYHGIYSIFPAPRVLTAGYLFLEEPPQVPPQWPPLDSH